MVVSLYLFFRELLSCLVEGSQRNTSLHLWSIMPVVCHLIGNALHKVYLQRQPKSCHTSKVNSALGGGGHVMSTSKRHPAQLMLFPASHLCRAIISMPHAMQILHGCTGATMRAVPQKNIIIGAGPALQVVLRAQLAPFASAHLSISG